MIFIIVYILSALVVGAVHWAEYQDNIKDGLKVSMQDKVINLYVVPLIPVFNTLVVCNILGAYCGMW